MDQNKTVLSDWRGQICSRELVDEAPKNDQEIKTGLGGSRGRIRGGMRRQKIKEEETKIS